MTSKIQLILLISLVVIFLPACSKNSNNQASESAVISRENRNSSQEIIDNQSDAPKETGVKMNPVVVQIEGDHPEITARPERLSDTETSEPQQDPPPLLKQDSSFSDEEPPSLENEEENQEVFEIQDIAEVKREVKVQNLSRKNQDILPYIGTQMVYPEDYLIGSLYTPAESSLENQSIARTTQEFLNPLKQSNFNDKVIGSSSVVKIRSLVTNIIEKQINLTSYRIGVITTDEKQSRVNIRLWSTLSTVEGELYLTKIDNKWYIEDLQANIMELARKSEKKEEAYMPSSYDFQ